MPRSVASDKRPYLREADGPEIDSSGAELFGEEPVDMSRVVVDGCTIQPSFLAQEYTVIVRQTFR